MYSSPATPDRCTSRPRSARRSSPCSARRIRRDMRRRDPVHQHRAHRSALQSVQPHPAAAGAVRRPHSGLPDRHRRRDGLPGSRTDARTRPARARTSWLVARVIAVDAVLSIETSAGYATGVARHVPRRRRRGGRGGRRRTRGSRRSGTRASTGAPSASASPIGTTACGGSPSCICTRIAAYSRCSAPSTPSTALLDRERPRSIRLDSGDEIARLVVAQLGRARAQSRTSGPAAPTTSPLRLLRMDARSTGLMLAAVALTRSARTRSPRQRRRVSPRSSTARSGAAAARTAAPSPTSGRFSRRSSSSSRPTRSRYVGVGPTRNFRARRWWRRGGPTADVVRPVEQLVPRAALAGSSGIWAARHAMRRAMSASPDLRKRRGDSRLRLLADHRAGACRHRAAAVAVVGAGDGRSGRRPRCAATGGSRDLRGSRRMGPRARARSAAAPHPARRPAARLHLPALAELPARTRRDAAARRNLARSRVSPSSADACCSTNMRPST